MNDFLKMDIFFVISTLAVVLLTILMSVLLWYVIRVARTLDRLSADLADEAHALKEDIDEARIVARKEGKQLLYLVDAGRKAVARFMKPSRKRKP